MRILPRVFALVVAVVSLGGSVRDASACSCELLANAGHMTKEELSAWSFDRAKTVVTGRVTDVHANTSTKRGERSVVVAHLDVSSVQKGDVPLGDVTIVTGYGGGDCGIPEALFYALGQNRDLTVELQKDSIYQPESPGEYTVTMCGFAKLSAGNEN
ncbi:MAG: hypothetical protein ABSG88_07735 [Bradyrhizobium sp.]